MAVQVTWGQWKRAKTLLIEGATEVVPEILKVIAQFSAEEKASDIEIASALSARIVAIVGPAVAKMTEFEAVLLQIAFGDAAIDGLPAEKVRVGRDEAMAAVFAAAECEAGFWRGLLQKAGALGSAMTKAQAG